MLTLAAREADIVSVNPVTTGGMMDFQTYRAEVFAQKIEWVRAAAGERFADLELHSMLFGVIVTENQREAAQDWINQIEKMFGRPIGLSIEDVLASPYIVMGTASRKARDVPRALRCELLHNCLDDQYGKFASRCRPTGWQVSQ